jgi:hypothetical protein
LFTALHYLHPRFLPIIPSIFLLIRYYLDNELRFPTAGQLGKWILVAPKQVVAKKKLVSALKSKYSSLENLNQAWATKFLSWELVETTSIRDFEPNAEALIFLQEFNGEFASEYFRKVRLVFKKYFPNKLYLGSRMNRVIPEVVVAASHYCDVVSFNKYELDIRDFVLPAGSADTPVLVGEFCFVRGGRDHISSGLGAYLDPQYRGRVYGNYISGCLENPAIIGAHWFQWSSQAISGRGDGENYEQGFIDPCDTPYWDLVRGSLRVAERMYELRLENKEYQYDF